MCGGGHMPEGCQKSSAWHRSSKFAWSAKVGSSIALTKLIMMIPQVFGHALP